MNSDSDQQLQLVITQERNRRALGHYLIVEDVEESEEKEEAAKQIITARHALGTVGREGLPEG